MCIKTDDVQMNYAKDNGDGSYSNATREIPSVTGVMTSFNRIGYTWAGGDYNLVTGVLRNEWASTASLSPIMQIPACSWMRVR